MSDALSLTPRQAAAWLYHGEILRRKELAGSINAMALASRGDRNALKQTIKDLTSEVL